MPAEPTLTHITKTLNHGSPLISCRFDPTGRFVFAGDQENKIVRWELASGKKTELAGHESWVRPMVFPGKSEVLISGGHEGKLIWWDAAAETPVPQKVIPAHQGWIRSLALSPDQSLLASAGNDLKIRIWSLPEGSLVQELSGHERHVYSVLFHPDGQHLASGDLTAKFIEWDLKTGQALRKFPIESLSKYDAGFMADYGGPYSMAFGPEGRSLFAGGITNVTNSFAGVGNVIVSQIDWAAGKEQISHLSKSSVQGTGWGVAYHPDGFVIAATGGQGGGHLFFWRPDQKEEFHSLNLGAVARDLSIHPDGLQLATAHFDKNLRLSLMGPKAS